MTTNYSRQMVVDCFTKIVHLYVLDFCIEIVVIIYAVRHEVYFIGTRHHVIIVVTAGVPYTSPSACRTNDNSYTIFLLCGWFLTLLIFKTFLQDHACLCCLCFTPFSG